MRIVAAVGLILCSSGCHHNYRSSYAPPNLPPAGARRSNPKVVVAPGSQGPIKYQWAFTNNPEGNKVLRFTPE